MPVSKLKNLTILILLLANLAMLGLLLPGRLAERREETALRESLSQLYADQEVALSPSIIPESATLYVLELAEDPTADQQAATALLGSQVQTQDDSTRYLRSYRSDDGMCSISRTGAFHAQLEGSEENGDLVKASKRILRRMGFTYSSLSQPERLRAGVYTVTATQAVMNVPVFGGDLTLTFSNNCLSTLDGVFFTGGSALTRVSEEACISAADALVDFLAARYTLGWVGSEICSMEQGYLRSETAAAAAVRLTPVWQLVTDTGAFYINGMTGEVTAVS